MRRTIVAVVALFVAFFPTAAGAATAADQTDTQAQTAATCDDAAVQLGRLYRVLLGRAADAAGLAYWRAELWAGASPEQVAEQMAATEEHRSRFGQLDDGQFIDAVYQNLLGRSPDPAGRSYWLGQVTAHGRGKVAAWLAASDELGTTAWPYTRPPRCDQILALGLHEVVPGIAVGVSGAGGTVTVVAVRAMVDYRAVDQHRAHAASVAGDVVVNANWFTPAGPEAPVVVDGYLSGSADIIERGQIVAYRPGCGGHDGTELTHVWQGEIYGPGECVLTAVSGVSLVHKGERADRYPGITITSGYTNTSTAHSFLGFNETELIVIATRSMNASDLADYAIGLGATEGVMLDGGGSTQIKTPTAQLTTDRTVPTFAVLDHRFDLAG